jgi:hypothetical protein
MAIGVSNNGELDRGVADFVNILDPLVMRGEIICTLCGILASCIRFVHASGYSTNPII